MESFWEDSRLLRRIKRLRNAIAWESAITCMSRHKDREALQILERLDLSDGDNSIAMVQRANCLYRLKRFSDAAVAYRDAISAETNWGARENRAEAAYIVGYCELFGAFLAERLGFKADFDLYEKYRNLLSLDVSKELKGRLLPLPLPSAVRRSSPPSEQS